MTHRYVVTGRAGQVVSALIERSAFWPGVEIVPLGRPLLNLAAPETVEKSILDSKPDLIISAAAFTEVDAAEGDEAAAFQVNGVAPGIVGESAAKLGIPVVHLSTDYVFNGEKTTPYNEEDTVSPLGVYGHSKLAGELSLARVTSDYAILRTAWVYSPYGKNFLRTMLRIAEGRDELNVVCDQYGNPTSALDIADGVLRVAENLLSSEDKSFRGVFHMTGSGDASWADFATEILRLSLENGGPTASIKPITTAQYPTPARRPKNSRLECGKLEKIHGVRLTDWKTSTATVVSRLLNP
ncbi:dTDP-4-dehydrorhamnose reductase [Rhizobium sp. Root1334]|uniref:dTDP-4-dehydrorhamnose reductase n=1 Tax=unclassified Rhizobium TaxID=2613769 RepID=UPI000AF50925